MSAFKRLLYHMERVNARQSAWLPFILEQMLSVSLSWKTLKPPSLSRGKKNTFIS